MSDEVVNPEGNDSLTSKLMSDDDWQGVKVSRYKIEQLLGDGGMGRVFLARDAILQREVALKVIPEGFQEARESGQLELFIREAQAVARLEHPNVVRVYDVAHEEGVVAIAMEYVSGGSLSELIAIEETLPMPEACRLMADAAEGLAYAHDNDMVHRDIKPANLMLTDRRQCKVVDFGTTHVKEKKELSLFKGKIIGTPHFVSPEVIRGEEPRPESDIYSLGVVLWWIIVGTPPFNGETRKELYMKHLKEKPPKIEKLCPDIPLALRNLIVKCMKKDADDRYHDCAELAAELRRIAEDLIRQEHSDLAKVSAALGDTGTSLPMRKTRIRKRPKIKKKAKKQKKMPGKTRIMPRQKVSAGSKGPAKAKGGITDSYPRTYPAKKKKATFILIAIGMAVLIIALIIVLVILASSSTKKDDTPKERNPYYDDTERRYDNP
jgi:serine/threonine-protein kinase